MWNSRDDASSYYIYFYHQAHIVYDDLLHMSLCGPLMSDGYTAHTYIAYSPIP